MEWIWNPKTKGSGIITCIPQTGRCPNNCEDCFFQSGRSYLEPLDENLPHVPPNEMTKGRIVRINDGNDSNVNRDEVERIAKQFDNYFFNTAIPKDLEGFSGPVVLTLNPGVMTDQSWHKLEFIPKNLMFVRFRANMWNLENLFKVKRYYTEKEVPVVITFMAYFTMHIYDFYRCAYEFMKRTTNSYWCITNREKLRFEGLFKNNPLMYTCGYKDSHSCQRCGNCIREYYNTKERMRDA